MKNVLPIFNAVLAIAIIILFVLVLSNRNAQPKVENLKLNDSLVSVHLPLAYVNIDSLLMNYQFAKDANEMLMKKEESARATLNTRVRQLQNEMNEFQRKLDANAFLSRERAEREHASLMQKQQQLQELEQRLTQELYTEQQKVNEQLRDTITNFLAEFNAKENYEIIFSNTGNDNILHAKPQYDITRQIIDELNARFKK